MSDYLSSVLDKLVPAFADEDGDWGRVVGDAGAETPTTPAHPWPVDATASAADGGRHGRWPARLLTPRRLVAIAVTALLAAALLVTPALGIGDRLLDLIQSTPGPPEVRTPVWSPDGRRIAFTSRRDGNSEVYVVNADGSGQRRLTRNAAGDFGPTWSPDGRKIAFERRGDAQSSVGALYVVNADGSGQRMLARRGSHPAWSPDGRTIAFMWRFHMYVMNADGSGHRVLTRVGSGQKDSLAWSPDGRKLAFLAYGDCGQCFNLYVVNSDGSGLRNLTSKLGPGRIGAGPASDSVWSPDGRMIAFVRLNTRHGVYVVNADGSGVRKLTPKPMGAAYAAPAWSPNGRKIAFARERDGNSEIYLMNADGSGQRNLTRNLAYDGDPAWSPDGRKITFVSNRDGRYAVYVMNADGSGQRSLR